MVMGERSVLYGEAAALLYGPRQRQEGSYMTRIGSAWPLARRLPEDTVPNLKMPSMYLLNVPTVDDQGGSCLTVYASKNGCDNRR